jgi:hypothetical protein
MVMLLADALLNKPIRYSINDTLIDPTATAMFRTSVAAARRVEGTEFVEALDAASKGVQVVADLFDRLPPVANVLWVEFASPRGGKFGVLALHVPQPHAEHPESASFWRMNQFVGDRKGATMFAVRSSVALDEHFLMVGNPHMAYHPAYPEATRHRISNGVVRFLQILEMLDCINVDVQYVDPAQRRRPTSRRVTAPDYDRISYETLVVKRMGQRTRSEAGEPTGTRPRSQVRGSTAHYGNCCPGAHEPRGKLFGRLEGRVWRNPHWAGNADNGTVVSELTIDPTGLLR